MVLKKFFKVFKNALRSLKLHVLGHVSNLKLIKLLNSLTTLKIYIKVTQMCFLVKKFLFIQQFI